MNLESDLLGLQLALFLFQFLCLLSLTFLLLNTLIFGFLPVLLGLSKISVVDRVGFSLDFLK